MSFVHLHVHSRYSLLDGTLSPEDIAGLVAARGMSAVALTDTVNLFGAVPFYKACKKAGVRPILGAELHVQPEGVAHEDPRREHGGYQLLALVEDEVGYANLCALITDAIYDGMSFKPRTDLAALRARHAGLVFLTGGLRGAPATGAAAGGEEGAVAAVAALRDAVGADRLYVELVDLGLEACAVANAAARAAAAAVGVPLVVTNAVHHADPSEAPVVDLLHAIAESTLVASESRIRMHTDQAYLKTPAEMAALFPADADALARTEEIAARCTFAYTFGTYHFPATVPPDPESDTDANWRFFYEAFPPSGAWGLPVPQPGEQVALPARPEGGGTLDGFFRWYAGAGLDHRLARVDASQHAEYRERLREELDIICRMQFPAYFLIVAEFINWSKDRGIPVGPGRGSAAGSLVAWAMGITDIDPIRFDLLFERFLNPERNSMPDIDVDFAQDRREESIQHVRDKYGAALVSQIITYNSLKAKAAVKDVARVLGWNFKDADQFGKLFPEGPGVTIDGTLADMEREESAQIRVRAEADPRVRRVISLARAVEGFPKSLGVHAAGVVIGDRPLVAYAPLFRDGPEGGPVVQYDMKSAEDIGLIKFDFLGLKTLDQIRDAIAMVRANDRVEIDLDRIDDADPTVYRLFAEGDTLAVFQFESDGMRRMLMDLKPTVIDDLVAAVALYRPGPLQSGMVRDFIDRKHGRQEVRYPLPMLEPILRSTYGTIVYQEQVMQIARTMSGYSLGEADLLRRAMGKKKQEEMDKQKSRFMEGATAQGIDRDKADDIFELLAKFAAYGFNKSHSAAYGVVAYQTAWLKAHHRPEFMAAVMTVESGNQKGRDEKVPAYIDDCRRVGIDVLPPCLNRSERGFRALAEDGRKVVRFGIGVVKNVGDGVVDAILAERSRRGPFRDPLDVFERLDPRAYNRRAIEALVRAGAFDFSGRSRAVLLASVEGLIREGARRRADREAGQVSLFGGVATSTDPSFRYASVPPWSMVQTLQAEQEVLGVFLSGRPMEAYERDVDRFASHRLHDLAALDSDTEVRVLAWPSEVGTRTTRNGERMAVVALDGLVTRIEAVFYPEAYSRSRRALEAEEPLSVRGRVRRRDGGALQIVAEAAEALSDVRARLVRRATLRVARAELDSRRVQALAQLFVEEPGACPVVIEVVEPGRYRARLDVPERKVAPSRRFQEGVDRVFGRTGVVTWD